MLEENTKKCYLMYYRSKMYLFLIFITYKVKIKTCVKYVTVLVFSFQCFLISYLLNYLFILSPS